jgi:hypothetical protein
MGARVPRVEGVIATFDGIAEDQKDVLHVIVPFQYKAARADYSGVRCEMGEAPVSLAKRKHTSTKGQAAMYDLRALFDAAGCALRGLAMEAT